MGSGTLITFPVLLAFGYAPVPANVSNTIGLVPGSVSGAIGYRRELRGSAPVRCAWERCRCSAGSPARSCCSCCPASAFEAIVPVFIALALVLTLLQPRIASWLAHREIDIERHAVHVTPAAVLLTGIYGGYFGAAQGIMLLAILGVTLAQDLQRTNALKNVLAGLVNAVAGLYFVFAAQVDWGPAAIIAAASIVGAQAGARYGRRLSPGALRGVVVVVGCSAIVRLVA